MQDALKDIFGPMFEAMLQGEMNSHLGYSNNERGEKDTVNRTFELRSCPHRFESLPFSYENKKTSKWRGYIKKSLLPLVL